MSCHTLGAFDMLCHCALLACNQVSEPVNSNAVLAAAHSTGLLALVVVRLCRWDDAIRVADTSRHPQTEQLKRNHYDWLLQTGQHDKAGSVKEREGDLLGAILLYMKGGVPARAAQVSTSNSLFNSSNVL